MAHYFRAASTLSRVPRVARGNITEESSPSRCAAAANTRVRSLRRCSYLGDGLAELRWKSGMRLYFSRITDRQGTAVLLILGGTKHGQEKDITKARVLLRRYTAEET